MVSIIYLYNIYTYLFIFVSYERKLRKFVDIIFIIYNNFEICI